MRLLDASDDDSLVTQAWGEDPALETWTEIARQLRALTDEWHAQDEKAPWAREPGARSVVGLLAMAGLHTDALSVVTMWLDLVAYDPEEAVRTMLASALCDAAMGWSNVAGRQGGAMVVVLHHAEVTRAAAGVQRFKSLPLAALERLSPSGLRVDVFPTWATTLTVSALGRVAPGFTIVLALN